jgi:hypothetical protein
MRLVRWFVASVAPLLAVPAAHAALPPGAKTTKANGITAVRHFLAGR